MQISIFEKFLRFLLIIAFMIFIWLPISQMQLKFTPVGENTEKRELTAFPTFNIKYPKEFILSFEKYFNDNFGLRTKLIVWNNKIMTSVFKFSPVTNVVLGKNGWLFFAPGLVDSYKRPAYTKSDLVNANAAMDGERKFMADNGIYFITVVAPDKHTIYPEYLPGTISRNISNPRRSQRLDYLNKHSSVVQIDLLPPLLEGMKKYPVYYKTDTHWNNYGSFIAYQEVMKKLKKKFPNLDPLTLDDFDISVVKREEPGDLATMLVMQDQFSDQDIKLDLKKESETKKLSEDKKVGKLLVYYDSFFDPHYPWNTTQYLRKHFKTAVTYGNNFAFDNDTIKAEKPDVVVFEVVERSL